MSTLHIPAEILSSLIGWFNNMENAAVVGCVMTAIFLASLVLLTRSHLKFISRLRSGAKSVRQAFIDPSWSAADRLNSASSALDNNTVLGQAWFQYRATIREHPKHKDAFVNLVDPRAWFAPERLPGVGYEKWAGTFAGIFLTIGLLFTFVELSAPLLRPSNAEPLRDTINGILNVSSEKFITLIAGIMFFVLWTLIARWFSSSQQHATAKFAAAVQALTTMMTPEVVLADQLLAAQDQADQMRTLANDVAIAFESKLTAVIAHRLDAVSAKIDEVVRPMTAAIEGMSTRIAGELRRDNVAAGSEMREAVEALKTAGEELRSARGSISRSGNEFGASIALAAGTIRNSVTRMTNAIEQELGDLESRIHRVDEATGESASSISAVGEVGGMEPGRCP
jgi:hypothetical protein